MNLTSSRTASVLALLLCILPAACGEERQEAMVEEDAATIALPDGFQPEGIAVDGDTFFVGSIPTGAVYRGEVTSGQGDLLVEPREYRSAIGLATDGRGRLLVAGGGTGQAYLYDATTGQDLAVLELADGQAFVNDVVVADHLAWFTDSTNPVLYRVDLPPEGAPATGAVVSEVPLSGDLEYQDGINTNGIAVTPDGGTLIVVQTNTGLLFTVDPGSGATREIGLGGDRLPGGDGILLDGSTLHVVQNEQNVITEVALADDLASATVERRRTAEAMDVPTTIAATRERLYMVNARFGTEPTPDTTYTIVSLPRP